MVGMKILLGFCQLAFVGMISTVVAWLTGPAYIAVGMLVMATCLVLLLQAAKLYGALAELPMRAAEAVSIIGAAFVFGLIWPALPVILALKKINGLDVAAD